MYLRFPAMSILNPRRIALTGCAKAQNPDTHTHDSLTSDHTRTAPHAFGNRFRNLFPCIPPHIPPNPPIGLPPPAGPLCAASPCIFSLTLRFTSKNFPTHRSRHTLSPLFRSPSRYSGGMHFLLQDCERLWLLSAGDVSFEGLQEQKGK